jgi:hypothetical protein
MMTHFDDEKTILVNELRKNMICASLDEAERMADEILKRENAVEKKPEPKHERKVEEKPVIEKQVENKDNITKQDVESLLIINNKIIEANFVKLKNYTDSITQQMQTTMMEMQKKMDEMKNHMSEFMEHPVEVVSSGSKQKQKIMMPATPSNRGGEFSPEDVSVEKIFYYGNK